MSSLIRPTHFPTRLLQDDVKLLNYCGTKKLEMGKVIHARSIVSNDQSGTNGVFYILSKFKALMSARRDFDQMNKQNVVSWSDDLISEKFPKGLAFRFLRTYISKWVSKRDRDFRLNHYKSALVLTFCIIVEDVFLGRQLHGYLLKSGLECHPYVKTPLVHLYRMLSDVVGAVEVLVSIPQTDTSTYNMFVVEKGFLDEALNIIRKMMADDMVWNKTTYIGMFGLCARLKYSELGNQVHNKLLKSDVELDVSVCNAMVKMYRNCGNVGDALNVLRAYKARDVVSWTTMMHGSIPRSDYEASIKLFSKMQHDNVVPDESTFCVILDASAQLFSMSLGNLFHSFAEKTGFKGDKKVQDALISMYLRTGDIKAAEKVFFSMTTDDIRTWDMMICGYCLHGFGNESLALFQEMLESGELDPTYATFVAVLSGCGQLGLVEEGFYYFYELMKQKGIEPDSVHYTCIMKILIKAGQPDEAFNFMASTPLIKFDSYAWKIMLNAPHVDKNNMVTRLADLVPDEWLADEKEALQSFGAANLTELTKIVRDRNKEPELSWVEVKRQTHKFVSVVSGDPEFTKHHKMMKSLFASIKADAGNVLEDSCECDGYHSEKLAVGYALLNAHDMAPIFIIKASGKMCDDCHSFMKLISKVRKSLITVRDDGYFHHFQDGSCSCADYLG
ncbi:pentatricopeptide repeat-containing protein At5g39680 [Lactuca sativa]|uniref:pentatricopeptide repeat-containing protein At5g39680 n=1 Tax=Lactuca sativa TaxID=4236 RepID=UPI000CA70F2A|nr:pentatricopeptide repeat-containing protein At5g39680 [Lactuca sativa]XP_042756038.1 pentatricopeptide repeat-containing protein At5g39680 [Lactuca sativa]XP_052625207.1 pentatricopeptide repeat-containing protein At5g39680 [Lactuca sativa]